KPWNDLSISVENTTMVIDLQSGVTRDNGTGANFHRIERRRSDRIDLLRLFEKLRILSPVGVLVVTSNRGGESCGAYIGSPCQLLDRIRHFHTTLGHVLSDYADPPTVRTRVIDIVLDNVVIRTSVHQRSLIE